MKAIIVFVSLLIGNTKCFSQVCSELKLNKLIDISSQSFSEFDDFANGNCYEFNKIKTDEFNITRRTYLYLGEIGSNPDLLVYETGSVFNKQYKGQSLRCYSDSLPFFRRFKKELKENKFILKSERLVFNNQVLEYKSLTHTIAITINSEDDVQNYKYQVYIQYNLPSQLKPKKRSPRSA